MMELSSILSDVKVEVKDKGGEISSSESRPLIHIRYAAIGSPKVTVLTTFVEIPHNSRSAARTFTLIFAKTSVHNVLHKIMK